jgi:hypothetical protein
MPAMKNTRFAGSWTPTNVATNDKRSGKTAITSTAADSTSQSAANFSFRIPRRRSSMMNTVADTAAATPNRYGPNVMNSPPLCAG